MKELKHGSGLDVTIVKVGHEEFLLKGNYQRLWQELKEHHYNKSISLNLNIPESTCLRLLKELIKYNIVETKLSTELKTNEVPEEIKDLVKNKDMRTIFYFNKAEEIKDLSTKSQITKKLDKIESKISNISNQKANKVTISLDSLKSSMLLFLFSLIMISLMIYLSIVMIEITIIAHFILADSLVILSILITGLLLLLKTYKELSLNSK